MGHSNGEMNFSSAGVSERIRERLLSGFSAVFCSLEYTLRIGGIQDWVEILLLICTTKSATTGTVGQLAGRRGSRQPARRTFEVFRESPLVHHAFLPFVVPCLGRASSSNARFHQANKRRARLSISTGSASRPGATLKITSLFECFPSPRRITHPLLVHLKPRDPWYLQLVPGQLLSMVSALLSFWHFGLERQYL